ncbi:MAG: hypothetical protein FD134_2607 [Gallionellaceae bacterium]|nr:MAG: hypothetical protein FD134_2607 [Gallionellaceae bacterium]
MKTPYLNLLAAVLVTGCAGPVHMLVKEDGTPFIGGNLAHDRGMDNRLVLEATSRRYEARGFVVERQTNLAELRKRYYGVDPKHWDRIFAGLDAGHVVYSLETVARSAEGQEISCRLMWSGAAKPAGVCTDRAGAAFPVRFE